MSRAGPRWFVALALGALACASSAPGPLHLTMARAGRDTRVTLMAEPGLKVNARLAPALELLDGRVLRFGAARLTADSAYFAEPPSAVLPGHHDQLRGTLHASVCREDELVCRSVSLTL